MLRRRIDVHQHIVPPAYADWLASQGVRDADGRELPAWSVDEALALMQSHDIATAVVSISTPGVHPRSGAGNDAARAKAREVNEFAARVAQDHPGCFGFFATLPVLDVDAALAEVTYAFDVLHGSGVVLLANLDGRYLGAPGDEPPFAELHRRRAVVFVHDADGHAAVDRRNAEALLPSLAQKEIA
jgi:hypothetical protein